MALQLDDVLALALQLSPRDRLELVSRVMVTVEPESETPGEPPSEIPAGLTWWQRVNALIDQRDLSAWEASEFDDPAQWVRNLRTAQDARYRLDETETE